jgi:hypothetical protein
MVYKCVSKLIMHLFNHKVCSRRKPLLDGDRLLPLLKFVMHFLEDAEATLMVIVHLRQQGEVVSRILFEHVIFDDHHLQLAHVELGVHLDATLINDINYSTFNLLRGTAV